MLAPRPTSNLQAFLHPGRVDFSLNDWAQWVALRDLPAAAIATVAMRRSGSGNTLE